MISSQHKKRITEYVIKSINKWITLREQVPIQNLMDTSYSLTHLFVMMWYIDISFIFFFEFFPCVYSLLTKANAKNGKLYRGKHKPILAKLCYLCRTEVLNIVKQIIRDSNQIVLPFLQMVCCFRAKPDLLPISGLGVNLTNNQSHSEKNKIYLIMYTL